MKKKSSDSDAEKSASCLYCDKTPKGRGLCDGHLIRYRKGYRGAKLSAPLRNGQVAISGDAGDPALTPVEEHRLRLEVKELRSRLNEVLCERVADERYQRFVGQIADTPIDPPAWVLAEPKKDRHIVMPTVAFSDWHFDEIVDPKQIQGMNGYNREIALGRLRNYFQNTVDISHKFLGGFSYPGIIMPWLGDNFSGNIHEELRTTNAASIMSSLLYWVGPMVAGLRLLADAFGRVYIPVVVGNHGRNTLKPINKGRVRDNFDWLWAQIIARELSGDKRITFAISEAPDYTYTCYTTTYHITHGDQAKGGTGIAAQWSPLMLMAVRKMKRSRFSFLVCGHWHQLGQFLKIRANGTGKGYDEFAFNSNYDYQPPLQDFWLTDPKHGIICDFPVHLMGRDEKWYPKAPAQSEPFSGAGCAA